MASLSFKSCFSSIDRICLLFVSFASFRGKRRRRTAPNKFVITRSNCTTACCLFQCFAFSCCVRKASDQLSIDVQSRTREILFPFARPVIFCIRTTPKSKFKGERKAFFFLRCSDSRSRYRSVQCATIPPLFRQETFRPLHSFCLTFSHILICQKS